MNQIEQRIAQLKIKEKELAQKLHSTRLEIKRTVNLYQKANQLNLFEDKK